MGQNDNSMPIGLNFSVDSCLSLIRFRDDQVTYPRCDSAFNLSEQGRQDSDTLNAAVKFNPNDYFNTFFLHFIHYLESCSTSIQEAKLGISRFTVHLSQYTVICLLANRKTFHCLLCIFVSFHLPVEVNASWSIQQKDFLHPIDW